MNTFRKALRGWRTAIAEAASTRTPPVVGWPVPHVGCGLSILRHGGRFYTAAHAKYADQPYSLYLGGRLITMCQDPAFMKYLYGAGVEDVLFYDALRTLAPGIGTIVAMEMTGPEGANAGIDTLRRFLGPRLQEAPREIDAELRRRTDGLPHDGKIGVIETFNQWIPQITTRLLAGPELARDDAFLRDLFEFDASVRAHPRSLRPDRVVDRGLRLRARLVARIAEEIARRRSVGDAEDRPKDFVDAMLGLKDPQGTPYSDEVVSLDLIGFLFATSANTPAAAAQCLLHILTDPALRGRVEAEQRALARKHGDALDSAGLAQMRVLTACFYETLRMYAPGLHMRVTRKPMDVGPYRLPAGRLIGFSPYALHHDPTHYSDPEVFDPNRFLKGPRLPAKAPSPAHFIAFGRGPHVCIGQHLARYEVIGCISRLLRDVEVELSEPVDPTDISWATNGIAEPARERWLRVRARTVGQRGLAQAAV